MGVLKADTLDENYLKAYNLKYVYEEGPGIKRIKRGKGFSFHAPDGTLITNEQERERLKMLAVPPSYNDVWYCPLPNGHLQATGFDTTDKKQYFYHSAWEELREITKFTNMINFANALPSFRRKISYILNHPDEFSHKERVLSAMFRILEKTGMRVGSTVAEKRNHTFGLTTLKKKHIIEGDDGIHFEFKGKGARELEYVLTDKNVADIIHDCENIPGQHFFDYLDDNGKRHEIHSSHINAYIKEHMGESFSAKDFRTWRFSAYFLEEALKLARKDDKPTLTAVLDNVAEKSGNTPAILKSSYVHPGLLDSVKTQHLDRFKNEKESASGLRKGENLLYNYITSSHAKDLLKIKVD